LKWKTFEDITVDFLLRVIKDEQTNHYSLEAQDANQTRHFDWFTPKADLNIENLSGAIIECHWNPEGITLLPDPKDKWSKPLERKGCWQFLRVRTDKRLPNTEWVVTKIEEWLKSPVSKEELIKTLLELHHEDNERKQERNQEKREFTRGKGHNPNWDEKRHYNPVKQPFNRNHDNQERNQDKHDTTEKREFTKNSHYTAPKQYKHQEKINEKPQTDVKPNIPPTEDSGSWRKKPAAISPIIPTEGDDGFEVVNYAKKKKGYDKKYSKN